MSTLIKDKPHTILTIHPTASLQLDLCYCKCLDIQPLAPTFMRMPCSVFQTTCIDLYSSAVCLSHVCVSTCLNECFDTSDHCNPAISPSTLFSWRFWFLVNIITQILTTFAPIPQATIAHCIPLKNVKETIIWIFLFLLHYKRCLKKDLITPVEKKKVWLVSFPVCAKCQKLQLCNVDWWTKSVHCTLYSSNIVWTQTTFLLASANPSSRTRLSRGKSKVPRSLNISSSTHGPTSKSCLYLDWLLCASPLDEEKQLVEQLTACVYIV